MDRQWELDPVRLSSRRAVLGLILSDGPKTKNAAVHTGGIDVKLENGLFPSWISSLFFGSHPPKVADSTHPHQANGQILINQFPSEGRTTELSQTWPDWDVLATFHGFRDVKMEYKVQSGNGGQQNEPPLLGGFPRQCEPSRLEVLFGGDPREIPTTFGHLLHPVSKGYVVRMKLTLM